MRRRKEAEFINTHANVSDEKAVSEITWYDSDCFQRP